ncbi:MAG: anti-sigma factor domain-containing protein [Stellaceae bacterium]
MTIPAAQIALARIALARIALVRPALSVLWERAALWRALAAGLAALTLGLLVAALVARPAPDFAEHRVIAVLRDAGHHQLWTIRLASRAHQIAIDSLAPPSSPPGRVYQLWLAHPGAAVPRPLGLLPQTGQKVIAETPANSRLLNQPGELLVTLEATGGSQRPGPSGSVQFHARLLNPG